jgi:tetratricopeptide (TPR) repeat protein
LTIRAQIAYDLGAFESANDLAVQSLDLYTAIDDHDGSINALRGLGTIARARFDDALARSWYEKSLALATRTSNTQKVSYALKSLADLERDLGNLEEAARLFERSACLARDAGDRMILTYILHGTGDLAMVSCRPGQAADHYRQSIILACELGVWRPVVQCVAGLAAVAAAAGDEARAGQLWGAREALERGLGWRMSPHERAHYNVVIEACVDAAPLAFGVAAERGRQMTPDSVIQYALDEV